MFIIYEVREDNVRSCRSSGEYVDFTRKLSVCEHPTLYECEEWLSDYGAVYLKYEIVEVVEKE